MNTNRRNEKIPSWLGWIGHMSTPREFLLEKSWASCWAIPKYLNTLFRALGVVSFANSPITGMLIFAGMLLGDLNVAGAAALCTLVALLACKLLQVPERPNSDGLFVFNSILFGCVLCAVLPEVLDLPLHKYVWILLAVGAFITCFVDQGFNSMISSSKLPGQSVAFNLVAICFFMMFKSRINLDAEDLMEKTEHNITETFDWCKSWQGVLLSAGQIYGVGTPASSVCVWLGFAVYSPLLTLMFFCGAVIGTFMGILFVPTALSTAYAGLFGYNSLLAAGGIVFFVVPSPVTIICALVNAILASCFQIAMLPFFNMNLAPVLSYPFNIAIMLILAIATRENAPVQFVRGPLFPEPSFPELHFYRFQKGKKAIANPDLEADVEVPLQDQAKP